MHRPVVFLTHHSSPQDQNLLSRSSKVYEPKGPTMAPDPSRRILQGLRVCESVQPGREFQTSAPTLWPDQIETGTAYHAIPESHMKAATSDA
jgi:hypothetical protein